MYTFLLISIKDGGINDSFTNIKSLNIRSARVRKIDREREKENDTENWEIERQ